MLMVDSSVWVDYFNGQESSQTRKLDAALGEAFIVIGDLILVELLQGFRKDADLRQAKKLIKDFPVVTLGGEAVALRAAAHYRTLRKKGITVRKTIDMVIGTYCIIESVPLLTADRDFLPMEKYLGLKLA